MRPAGDRVAYGYAWATARGLLARVADRARRDPGLLARAAARRSTLPWLGREARLEAIAAAVGHDDWRRWPSPAPADEGAAWSFEVAQLLLEDQHDALARRAGGLGLTLYGDLPIGISFRDRWWLGPLFLPGYSMGAPPSRTNPEGQPWGFPVFDPRALHRPGGAARSLVETRVDRLLRGHRGLRIDHPHGWVCPWVYRSDEPDPLRAVAGGARLHESPDLPDHPALAAFARVRPDQLDRSRPRHDDGWVRRLEPEQVDAYADIVELLLARVRARGGDPGDVMVEVLSSCPRPLAAVLERHGLGRFRVTQKARVDDPEDIYRSDRALPADWVLIGNHDTPPLRAVIEGWRGTPERERRAAFLARRLALHAGALAGDPALATALLAELFLGPARNVIVFWPDLFGLAEPYNRPGVVAEDNWSLRLPPRFEAAREAAVRRGDAPDLDLALDWALRARGLG